MARKRPILQAKARACWGEGRAAVELEDFATAHPELLAYAKFRAVSDRVGDGWRHWPESVLVNDTMESESVRYHLFVQFLADRQLHEVAGARAGLYLDFPVGVHPGGFDTWYARESFLPGASVGAPPDEVYIEGQNWGSPALHPNGLRDNGYGYLISCLAKLLERASLVRIDHVMALERIWAVPDGSSSRDGAYLSYRSDELRAILALEAVRSETALVGEDLGTVSKRIQRAMDADGLLHSYVLQFEASAEVPFPEPPRRSLASFGTHDLARIAGFWQGSDIDARVQHGLLPHGLAGKERERRSQLLEQLRLATVPTEASATAEPAPSLSQARATGVGAVMRAMLLHLAASAALVVQVDLGDLLLSPLPENQPGSGDQQGNWRHRYAKTLGELAVDEASNSLLEEIDGRRQGLVPTIQPAPDGAEGPGDGL